MKKEYGLTQTELELMEYFWKLERKVSFKEILEYFTDVLHKNWKKQTLSTYLLNLQKAGLISADANGKNYYYCAVFTKEEHIQRWTKEILKQSFDNSITRFVSAFSAGKKLSKKDAEELKQFLDD